MFFFSIRTILASLYLDLVRISKRFVFPCFNGFPVLCKEDGLCTLDFLETGVKL